MQDTPFFTEKEKEILRIVQKNLPDTLTPYATIAEMTGVTEKEVLDLLQRMKTSGAIRRFGASLKHQKAGFSHNAMVAWKVTPETVNELGRQAARNPMISHCYYRPSSVTDWPYELYTMIHGQQEGDCQKIIDELRASTALDEYAILESIRELKKTSMTYF